MESVPSPGVKHGSFSGTYAYCCRNRSFLSQLDPEHIGYVEPRTDAGCCVLGGEQGVTNRRMRRVGGVEDGKHGAGA